MSLVLGSRVGPYEVLSLLGAGGMGEVYRARDGRLNRFVALKVLPSAFTADPQRLARFSREAETLAGLNHPNIAQIYGLEDVDGARAIVMELVEGDDLSACLNARLPIEEAIAYAVQIAAALEAAHDLGIVHRDLKPGNIRVRRDGVVKVLDFGLATAAAPSSAPALANSPTMTSPAMTGAGTLLGTAGYMSPEQARGKPVDRRTDLWAFGCVLYEMVGGKEAFSGDNTADTLAAILRSEPDWSMLPPSTPPALVRLLHRCLQKDVRARLQSAGDARIELEELQGQRDIPSQSNRSRKRAGLVTVAVVAGLLVAAGVWALLRPVQIALPPEVVPITRTLGDSRYPTFSPDGEQIAYSWAGEHDDNIDIYTTRLGQDGWLRLTNTQEDDVAPAWSPDGKRIAFVRLREPEAAIFLSPVTPAGEIKLADFRPSYPFENVWQRKSRISWSPDGHWLVFDELAADGLAQITAIDVDTSDRHVVLRGDAQGQFFGSPTFSPSGHTLAFAKCYNSTSICESYVMPVDPRVMPMARPSPLLSRHLWSAEGFTWTPDEQSVIVGSFDGLLRVPLSGGTARKVAGSPAGPAYFPALSPAGNRLAFAAMGRNSDLWELREGSAPRPFASTTAMDNQGMLSPDGQRIVFVSNRMDNQLQLWVSDLQGSPPVRLPPAASGLHGSPRWSRSGKLIAFDARGDEGIAAIYVTTPEGGRPQRLTDGKTQCTWPSFSHDDKWIYFSTPTNGRREIWKMPSGGGPAVQVTDNGGATALESADGQTLFYNKETGGPVFQRSTSAGSETQLLPAVHTWDFYPLKDGILFVTEVDHRRPYDLELKYLGFSDKNVRLIAKLRSKFSMGLSASEDGSRIYYSGADATIPDTLMMLKNFR